MGLPDPGGTMNPDEVQELLGLMADDLEEFWNDIVPHLDQDASGLDALHGRVTALTGSLHVLSDWVAHEFVEIEVPEDP